MITINIKKVSPKNLKDSDLVLDIRTTDEVAKKCLAMPFLHEDSATINVSDFIKKHNLDKNKTLNVLCRSGKRALDVAKKFFEEGYKNIQVIEGGMEQAEKDGIKVVVKK